MSVQDPDDTLENELHATGAILVAGCDEVGRGSWAGPVCVGALIAGDTNPPCGIRDSKLLSPARREQLQGSVSAWARAWSIGSASVEEIDTFGMSEALHLAATRALKALPEAPDAVILDGPHDYIRAPWRVTARAKADLTSRLVAAASILAKTYRDNLLVELSEHHPEYRLERNAGYPSPAHRAALREHGPVPGLHRLSWKFVDDLPGYTHLRRPAPSSLQRKSATRR